jgi:dolichol-phosphate mannosyltransferase
VKPERSIVIIPTYNEIENIDSIIAAVLKLEEDFHVLIVDDNSPDGTGDRVEQLQKQNSERIFLLRRTGKLGLGTAYIAGFQYCLEQGFDYVFEMDADFSHNPKDLLRLLEELKNDRADVVIGSRYIGSGGVRDWPIDRIILSFGASIYVRLITWMNVKDPTAGFVGYKRKVLESLDLSKVKFVGYAFQIEMKFYSHKKGFKLKEVPIIFTDRVKGKSKMNSTIISEAIMGVLAITWKGIKGYYQ